VRYQRLFSSLNINEGVISNRLRLTVAVRRPASEDGHITEANKGSYKKVPMRRDALESFSSELSIALEALDLYTE
jgi:hypothetical protein